MDKLIKELQRLASEEEEDESLVSNIDLGEIAAAVGYDHGSQIVKRLMKAFNLIKK